MKVSFTAELWEHEGEGAWHFVSMPVELSDDVRDTAGTRVRGFGSLRVRATIGATTWTTSVFPSRDGAFLLPVKKAVRAGEDLVVGDRLRVELELLDLPGARLD